MTKEEARKLVLNDRKKIDVKASSDRILNEIKQRKILNSLSKIGFYYPLSYEPNLLSLLEMYPNKSFYLPVTNSEMHFCRYTGNEKLVQGKFKVLEPNGFRVEVNDLDCILIPCLATSESFQRLGYGAGCYDKALKSFKGLKVGICHLNFQHMNIEMELFDLKMDIIL